MELDGVLFEEQVPNMQSTQLIMPHVNCPKQFGFGDNLRFQDSSSNLAFTAQDVNNRNHDHALLFSSYSSEDDHLPCFDVMDRDANMLGGTNKCLSNLGNYDYIGMDCRNVLGHVEVEKPEQIGSRGAYFDSIMAKPAIDHDVDLGCDLTVPMKVNMNSTNGHHDLRLDHVMSRFVEPGETSCIRNSITTPTNQKQMAQVKKTNTFKTIKNANWIKGQWTLEEDRLLVRLVEQHGLKNWSQIAQVLNGRKGKQCRERWLNHLRPNIKKDTWTDEEDMVLINAHIELGNKWAEIAKRLPGRTENSIKNHWNATKRRLFSRKGRSSKQHRSRPTTPLQSYIKSLGLTNPKLAQTGGPTNSPSKPMKMEIEEMPWGPPLNMGPSCHLENVAIVDDGHVGLHVEEAGSYDEAMMMMTTTMMSIDPPSIGDEELFL